MNSRKSIALEVAEIMPIIARRVVLGFFQKNEIPQAQILTIMALFKMESCRLSELSRNLNVSAPTATGIVDRLERSGYVRKSIEPKDRRALSISLTAKGRRMAEKFRQFLIQRWEEVLLPISSEDQHKFVEILYKVQMNSR